MGEQGLKEWLDSGKYLPGPMRDFHDQKDLFKAIHETIEVEKHDYCKDVSWVAGQCYVIDIFLWYMAQRGYTLQKSRENVKFRDLYDDVQAKKAEYDAHYAKMLMSTLGGKDA